MSCPTRRSVLAALGAAIPTAGCLTGFGSEDPGDSTTATTTDDPTTAGDAMAGVAADPDPDHSVTLNNEGSETRTVRVWVTRGETGETVFEETRESPPGTEVEVYNLKRADPDGIESFAVCGELVGADAATDSDGESPVRDCETLRSNACYGMAHVVVGADGSLRIVYSIC